MKQFFIVSHIFIATYTLLSCTNDYNQVPFSINSNDRKILVPVQLDDGVTGNFVFDTFAACIVDSSFCASHPSLSFYNDTINAKQARGGSFFANTDIRVLTHQNKQKIKIGESVQIFNNIRVWNLKGYMNNDKLDGAFNIPPTDTSNIWELNFDHNYIKIHKSKDYRIPENCFVFPMVEDTPGDKTVGKNAIKIQLPIKIECVSGDTLTMNRVYYIDTGMPWDIVLMRQSEDIDYFADREDATWIASSGSYLRYHNVKAFLSEGLAMDSVRIYTNDRYTGLNGKNIIGINFLKRFNVFFDMKNRQVGLQPVAKYSRIINPLGRRYHYSTKNTADKKIVIRHIADYKGNYYKEAGLQVGDELVAVDNKPYKDIGMERWEFYKRDTLVFDIIRNGKPLRLLVDVDNNEQQGD